MTADVRRELDRPRWPWLSLLPLGMGAWAPILAGVRARCNRWIALGVLWTVITLAGWIAAAVTSSKHNDGAGVVILVGWIGAIATSFAIRGTYERRISSPLLSATEQAEERLSDRARARELARTNPALAAEMGIGRPDLPGAAATGLVDVNNASAGALRKLPGVDDALATRIAEIRAEVNGFSSLADMGAALDLDGLVVEGLRDRVVFLPRTGR